jgi:hypothetical protein
MSFMFKFKLWFKLRQRFNKSLIFDANLDEVPERADPHRHSRRHLKFSPLIDDSLNSFIFFLSFLKSFLICRSISFLFPFRLFFCSCLTFLTQMLRTLSWRKEFRYALLRNFLPSHPGEGPSGGDEHVFKSQIKTFTITIVKISIKKDFEKIFSRGAIVYTSTLSQRPRFSQVVFHHCCTK